MNEEGIAPYRKKKDSSRSKSSKKADHKHIWEECFLHSTLPDKMFTWIQDPIKRRKILDVFSPGFRCVFCGRLKMNYDNDLRYEHRDRFFRARTKEELIDLRPEWPIVEVPGEDWYKL